ncbi:HAMP domain-containing sensor histidine kinase [Ferruginibacter albus]|uniref:HAMP domain-containing sensor histidine kinase n=1 Tax=Ferruginibacter albus TaxID=2875540 RepID=UPI001CC4C16C|nr:ATP-binding protein [Ferruginibacter albus]UAY52327.1 cell wall metabolism sensor histidine kinase WalK [Ferruginibacter albus]
MRLKNKLRLAFGFLFLVILCFGIAGIYYITQFSSDADKILKNNYETLVYDNNMLKVLNDISKDSSALNTFENNLQRQEKNVTEQGEGEFTKQLRQNFESLKKDPSNLSYRSNIIQAIQSINNINQVAIMRKNHATHEDSQEAIVWLTSMFVILTLIAFTLVVNFPGAVANPIRALSEGIKAIAQKNYQKRIHLEQKDEFGDLANAFNIMAEKLDEFENSNLAKLKFEKKRIETIINQMKDGIVGLDAKKNILFLNEVAAKILGLKEEQIINKYAPDVALQNDLMRTLLQQQTNKKELKIYADNKESYFNKDTFNVLDGGEIIGQVIVLRNITPFHELNEAKTNFIATVSHELKTPISSIKMSAQLLSDDRIGALSDEQKELIGSVREDADRLLKITGELLNMTQVETGNIQLKFQPVFPEKILEHAIQAIKFQSQQKSIELKTTIQSDLPAINVDEEKTTWVLINFLTNAIKYSSENSTIEINLYKQTDAVEFAVKDHGRGIEKKYLPKIFDRYFKVPGTGEKSGTGLGLAISKEFIEAQHGIIWVKSVINEGSTFGFSMIASGNKSTAI